MATRRTAIASLLATDLHKVYIIEGKEYPLIFPSIVGTPGMETNPITDLRVSGLGAMPEKPEGEQFTADEIMIGGSKEHEAVPFGLAVEVTWEAWRDELYGVLREMIRCLKRASRNRYEVDAHAPYNHAFDAAPAARYQGFDSLALCHTAHTSIDSTLTWGNRPNPDIGLSNTGIQDGILHFYDLTGDRGLPCYMTPSMILTTPTNVFACREILGSAGKPYTAQNERNALLPDELSWQISRYITTSTYWFMVVQQGEHDINLWVRDENDFDLFDDPFTRNAVAASYQRHISGYNEWRGIYGSTG